MSPRLFWQRATSRSANSKFRCRPSSHSSSEPAPPARPRSSTRRRAKRFDAELLDLVDILILNETELGFLTGTELRDSDDDADIHRSGTIVASRRGSGRLRHVGQARHRGADRGQKHVRSPAARSRPSTPLAPAIVLSARSPRCWPADSRFSARSATPTSPPRSACSGWARRRRCRPSRKSRPFSSQSASRNAEIRREGYAEACLPPRPCREISGGPGAPSAIAHQDPGRHQFTPAHASGRSSHRPPAPA